MTFRLAEVSMHLGCWRPPGGGVGIKICMHMLKGE